MVQREVGERFAAAPRTPAYGIPSVLAQLACDVRVLRTVSRNVFHPVPNVDSVLVGLRRHGPAPAPAARARPAGLRPPPQGAGPLARRSPRARRRTPRPRPGGAGGAWATPPTPAPRRSRRPTGATSPSGCADHPRAWQGQRLPARGRAARRRSAPARLRRPAVTLADELSWTRRGRGQVGLPGRRGRQPGRPRARGVPRGDGLGAAPAATLTIAKRIPVAAGMGGGSADAAAALRLASRPPACRSCPSWRWASAPTSRCCCPARALMTGAGEHVEPLPAADAPARSSSRSTPKLSAARGLPRVRRARRPRSPEELEAAARGCAPAATPPPSTTSRPPPARCARRSTRRSRRCARRREDPMVSGSGPTVFGSATTRSAARGLHAAGYPADAGAAA